MFNNRSIFAYNNKNMRTITRESVNNEKKNERKAFDKNKNNKNMRNNSRAEIAGKNSEHNDINNEKSIKEIKKVIVN